MTLSPERIVGLSKMAGEIKKFGWENTALGAISEWDDHLVVHANMMLSCPFPMMIWWGSELLQLYNDSCSDIISLQQSNIQKSLGQKANDFWSEAWDTISDRLKKLHHDPLAVFEEDQLVPIYRGNHLEHVYWTFSYSNLMDSKGNNAGILIIFKETSKSNTELRHKREEENFLLSLTDKLTGVREVEDIYTISLQSIHNHFCFYDIGYIKINRKADNLKILKNFSTLENVMPAVDFKETFLNKSDVLINESGKINEGYSIKFEKINTSEENGIETYFYAILPDDFQWNQFKQNTFRDACKRVSDLAVIAESQNKLMISESRYRSLFENILDAFMVIDFIFDNAGNPINYTFVTTNPAFEIQSGLKNVVGKTILEIMPDVENEWIKAYGSVATTGNPIQFNQYNEGTKRYYEVFASSVKEHPSQVVVVFRDVTEKKREDERKKKFLNLASHELKTPLTSIYGYLQIIQRLHKDKKYEMATSILEKSVSYVNRMNTMINGFLHLSKIEDSIESFHLELVNITELINECYQEAVSYHNTHKIVFSHSDCHYITVDRKRIMMVVQNLITNAVLYSPKGSCITISCIQSNGQITISVEDEGIGISPHEIKNIFKKFYRIEDNPVTGVSGFGLGLYISSEILKQHNSEIIIRSKMGKGSIFHFSLPLQ